MKTKSHPKCILISFFNSNNIGDILIANQLYNDISACGFEVVKCSYGGNFKIIGHRKKKKSYKKVDSKIKNNIIAVNHLSNKILNKARKLLFWLRFNIRIKECDVLFIGGGNMIMDLTVQSKSWLRFKKYVDIAKKYNKRVVVLSIGIGPFQTVEQEKKTIEVLNECDFVTYRDEKSYNIGSNGVVGKKHFLSIDPVFTLTKYGNKFPNKKNPMVGLCVINTLLFDSSLNRYNNTLVSFVELAKNLVSNNYQVVVFSTERNDYKMVKDVVKRCDNNRIYSEDIYTSEDLLYLYSSKLSFLIGTRMHSLIVALTQHIPLVGLSWQQKVDSMFALIESRKDCFPIDNIMENIDNILSSVNNNIANESYIENRKKILTKIVKRYEINERIIKSFL